MPPRTVALLAFEGAQLLDVMAPAEVFSIADAMAGGGLYRVVIVSADGESTVSSSGLPLGVQAALNDLDGTIDTFFVPGTYRWRETMEDAPVLATLLQGARRSERIAGVCAGAFLLGAVGLLDGRRATTHWQFVEELASRFPATAVERDPIFVADGNVFTSSGGTAGIDLALALVEADHGPVLARDVARFLVVFMQRPGGQTQFSVRLRTEPTVRAPLRDLLDAIAADPAADHRLAALSSRAGFSERHLSRVFLRELGTTPARYVEAARVEAARSLLESSDAPLDVIAGQSGLGSAETLRRTFNREVGISPHAYRQRFRTTGVTP
jgi:transcriptional regulator GlxA family with amidase domain